MKKIFAVIFSLILIQCSCSAKDILQFDFPNEGWHKVMSPDKVDSKKCYVPYNQTEENYTEMLIFTERILKSAELSPATLLHKQLGKDRNNYYDIVPEYIVTDENNSMVTWCSKVRNTCAVERSFKGKEGVIIVIYLNKAPHYSQNMFGQWSNILSKIKVYTNQDETTRPDNLIEL